MVARSLSLSLSLSLPPSPSLPPFLSPSSPLSHISLTLTSVFLPYITPVLFLPLSFSLHIDTVNFLGISIVGQTSEDGAGGIFVGSVMKG